jgi:hypothetical protein
MPSIGNDLALIRAHQGYSIEDIQKATKIPIYTLQSIEDGTIFTEPSEINTYVRSFVRTYGRAVKLDDELLSQALDQEELGNYNHLLLKDYPEIREKEGIEPEPEPETDTADLFDADDTTEGTEPEGTVEDKDAKTPSFQFEPEKKTPPAPKQHPGASSKPDLRNINWAGIGPDRRNKKTQMPGWIISAGLIIILIVAFAIILTQFGLFESDEDNRDESMQTEQPAAGTNQDLSLGLSDQAPDEQVAELEETLELTVYAAYSRLDPVRVWSDLKPRIDPYWMDEGTAYNFEFQDTIYVRGNYDNMLLFLNGNRIDNIRSQHFNEEENAVELTRSLFDTDPRWATPVPLELPGDADEPDTVMNRPSF